MRMISAARPRGVFAQGQRVDRAAQQPGGRAQRRQEGHEHRDAAQIAGVAIAVAAAVIEPSTTLGAIAVAVVAVIHRVWSRRQPPPVKVVGYRQMLLGLLVVAATATGALL